MPGVQRVSLKILTDAPASLNLDPFLAIFGRWRQDQNHPARWIDLADYAHMPRGPGIVLIGQLANFGFDLGTACPGIVYATKGGLTGSTVDRLRGVFRDAFAMAARVAAEPEFPSGVNLRTGSLELAFNDRLETPNNDSTDGELRPWVSGVLDELYGAGAYRLHPEPDPGRRYGFSIDAEAGVTPLVLSARL